MNLNYSEGEYDLLCAAADALETTPAKLVRKWSLEGAARVLVEAGAKGRAGTLGGSVRDDPALPVSPPAQPDMEDIPATLATQGEHDD